MAFLLLSSRYSYLNILISPNILIFESFVSWSVGRFEVYARGHEDCRVVAPDLLYTVHLKV